ncbi:DNA polymerase III subunit gamma/tau [Parabacteroides sp. AD58]|uniref:DNA polymerase III subunit gamma/tau n=1 Tax=Parabacteroides absconsus TaxID=2951805 RepID=A0ABZ2IW86_9BACT|nr:DNA polymerase III subunit gamma/tau [Parabacteroides sp. AD58]MCM6903553.1 DNA polymerase III subunit gamma/tau [Parabacteroides sp. AD58]
MDNYIVSARKYRPSTFKDVVGQKALTTTLKNAIQNQKLAHAYLFCGPRGVGKTSCARIFAKTINCMHPTADGEACNACESCQAFNEQRSLNIHELDAASNNSVDDIRSLIDQVRIPPAIGKYKVFIIDEVHMLSPAAFNAFLKTLEEPPHHALFILATTERHKVLPTILSRCQTYNFNRISIADMVEHLEYVASKEGIQAEPEALNVIAQKADGGMRDALSIFDQVASYTNGNITYQAVIQNLNVLDYDYYFRMTDLILNGNIRASLLLLNEIINKGFDAQNIVTGLASHFRDLLVCKDPATLVLFEVGASIREHYKEMAQRCPETFLFKAIELANTCDQNYRTSRNKRLLVELMLIQLCQLSLPAADDKKKVQLEPINTPEQTPAQPATSTGKIPNTQQQVVTVQEPPAHIHVSIPETNVSTSGKRPGRPPMGTSLKEIAHPKVQQQNPQGQTVQTSATDLRTNFSQEQLQKAWDEYANTIEKKVYLKNIMSNSKPQLLNNFYFEVGVHNPGMQEELINNAIDILAVLRQKLQNTHIQMRVRIMESNEKHLAYTSAEKYQHMLEINPLIDKLRKDFDLRTE